MKKNLKWLNLVIIIFNIILSGYLAFNINKLNVIPVKYFAIGIVILFLINILIALLLIFKNIATKILAIILTIVLVIVSMVALKYIKHTNDFLDSAFNNNTVEISTFNIIVLNNSTYSDIESLISKNIGFLKDNNEALNKINEITKSNNIEYEDVFALYDDLLDNKTDAILLETSVIDIIEEERKDLKNQVKIIYSFDLETIIKNDKENNKDIIRPMNIYISGSDSRSSNIQNKSRSDLNMVMTINPYTNKVLLTSVPRDYYVQVHGQTGLKDKLTHSGIYGLDISTATMEDLFDIEIDYSVKVGFNAVREMVDLVGGIQIESDRTFNSSHIKGWTVKEGLNYFDGKQALAYAGERYAYPSGDRHRIQNQQQVLEATLKKILNDKLILTKYDEILKSLGNFYRTDIPRDTITTIVKYQLDKGAKWTFEKQWVDGKGASLNTHTAPQYKRYVMIPYEDDVKEASLKIKTLLEEK